ncbi:MAG: hypothetical protein CL758_08805 [Chloroflexi bacterium]|nr:hypothetical protein [Chloroflexota bacterium]|tara:strand:- start:76903 stop:78195 length:1293 start_codon:yes stop_codon:yes gene_type:complete
MSGALEGIKVIDYTQIVAGPFAGSLLSDMGADVIKVEPTWGEPQRESAPFIPNETRNFLALNRGKKSLPLNLKHSKGLEIFYKLVLTADVVIINSRPDVPVKLKIDYESLKKINPKIIYCENSTYGTKGPMSHLPGSDLLSQAVGGLVASDKKVQNGLPQFITASPVVDHATGFAMCWGVTTALYHREKTGKGQKIDTSLLGTVMGLLTPAFVEVDVVDKDNIEKFINNLNVLKENNEPINKAMELKKQDAGAFIGSYANNYYRMFQVKDGVIAVGILGNRVRKKFMDLLGIVDFRLDSDFDVVNLDGWDTSDDLKVKKVYQETEEKLNGYKISEILPKMHAAGIPAAEVLFPEETSRLEQVKANGLMVELDHSLAGKYKTVGPVIKMSETPLVAKLPAPALGEHTDHILKSLGYNIDDIEVLRNEDTIY